MDNINKVPIFWPHIPKKKILKEIKDTLNSRWLGQGPKVNKFEKVFGDKFGYKYPLFVNSGTSALELAYHLIGLKKGDEVIVPILNCTAGQMGLKRLGVKIVFADIEKETFNIEPEDIERKITKKTKAIVVVHLGGISASNRIYKIAKKHNIPVITDSAQHHAKAKGDYICYSFQAIKHFTTCDGGMLVLNNKKEYKRAKLLRWFGIDRDLKKRHNYQAWEKRKMTFDIEEAGFKFQPTDIDASFGLAGILELDKTIKYRERLALEYLRGLEFTDEVDVVTGGSYWLFGILIENRDELADYLTKNNIENNLIHLRNDIFDIFGGKRQKLPNMNWIEPRYLYLPMNTHIKIKDVKYVTKKIRAYYGSRA